MDKLSVYKKAYTVELRDSDFSKTIKLSALFGYFQDIASMAVEDLDAGITTLQERFGVTWVLIRIRADIERFPEWNEPITVETWPQEPKKLEFERDYIVRDSEGRVLIRAVSTWVLMDVATREIRRTDVIAIKYPAIFKERALQCRLGRLKPFGTPELAYKKVISYSDIDFNGHLNNTRYIDFIMDCFEWDKHKLYGVRSIELSYVSEALPGEGVVLYRDISAAGEGVIYIEGQKEKDNAILFTAQVTIAPRNEKL